MATRERLIIETMFRIPDKEGRDVDFVLNDAQRRIDTYLTGRDVYPKARQEGVSSYFLARSLARCLSMRNRRAVVISHEQKATERLLMRVHYMLDHLRGPKASIKNLSKNEITFPKTDSMFYIGTAGSKTFGRGDTITDLHLSEVAFWEDASKLLTGLFQAVPITGAISIESTGNGVGNWYHRICMRAANGQGRYKLHFLPWHTFSEYTLSLGEAEAKAVLSGLVEEWEEPALVAQYNLTAGQIAWRRLKLEELEYDLTQFKQEYPMTLDECFQSTGASLFNKVNYIQTPDWSRDGRCLHRLSSHPRPGCQYLIGADVASGAGRKQVTFKPEEANKKAEGETDNSVIQIATLGELEQVAEWVDNRTPPDKLAFELARFGRLYNDAFISVESNNHGLLTLSELKKVYPNHLIYTRPAHPTGKGDENDELVNYGVRTSSRTKPLMVGKLRRLLAEGMPIHSDLLLGELRTFVEKEDGKLEALDGCFDDRVMALAVLVYVVERAQLLMATPSSGRDESDPLSDPFTLDSIIKELTSRGNSFPIATQDWPQ